MDKFDAMRTYIAVARLGSFTKAADQLQMSPQLVSKYVSQLEAQLGTRLLNRTTRSVQTTEAGRQYEQHARNLLQELEAVENQLGDLQSHASGQLRISAPVSFGIAHMAPLLVNFQSEFPRVSVDLQLNDRKVDIIDEGFDFALRIGHLKSSSLVAKKLAQISLHICAAPSYLQQHGEPQTLNDVALHQILHYSYMEDASSPLMKAWLAAPRRLQSNNGDVLTAAAVAGHGLTIQPSFIVEPFVATQQLKCILTEHTPKPIGLYAVYAHRTMLASKMRAFLDFSSRYFAAF